VSGRQVGLLITVSLGLLPATLAVEAQPAAKVHRIGFLLYPSPHAYQEAFLQGLRALGYTEGQNIAIERRHAHGAHDRLAGLAAELVRLKMDVIVVDGTASAIAAKAATATIPIVFTLAGDPVGSGLVASLARPGGNVTGLSNLIAELSGKQLQLLKEAVPEAARVAILYNPVNPATAPALHGAQAAARAFSVQLQVLEVRTPNELGAAFSAMAKGRAGALLVVSDPVFATGRVQLLTLSAKHRLPGMFFQRYFVEAGGLMSYAPNFADQFRRAAYYVDKILKGANPADLPVEQPMRFELVLNLKTAKTLGLTIPPAILVRADNLIE
jgi:putative ABC transport system substrate-binding protein